MAEASLIASRQNLTEVIGLLKKVLAAPINITKDVVMGSGYSKKAKLASLRQKRQALVDKLGYIKRLQRAKASQLKQHVNALKTVDAVAGTDTLSNVFGRSQKKNGTSVTKKRKPNTEK